MKTTNFSTFIKSNVNTNKLAFNSGELISIGASATIGLNDFLKLILSQTPTEIKKVFISTQSPSLNNNIEASKDISYNYLPNLSFSEFIIELLELILIKNYKIIFIEGIDYIHFLDHSALFFTIKKIAVKYQLVIIVTLKISKQCERRGGEQKPRISDIKNSNVLIDLSDKIIFPYRYDRFGIICDEHGNSTIDRLDLQIVKNNEGEPNTLFYKI